MRNVKNNAFDIVPNAFARAGRAALATLAVLSLTAAAAGCHHGEQGAGAGEIFPLEERTTQTEKIGEVQAAVAARADATLRPYHFDRAELNSLGRQKLDLMLKDEEASLPLVVYLDLPDAPESDARHTTVQAYMNGRGLMEDQVRLEVGSNPGNSHPAAPSMRMLHMLDAGTAGGTNPEPAGSAGAAPAMSAAAGAMH